MDMKDDFKISEKKLLDARNAIFKDYGIPELEKNGYVKSPFKTSWFGQYDSNISGYSYELCKLTSQNHLNIITADMVKGDKWIKIYLNIFELNEKLHSLDDLKDCDGINFKLPPHNAANMQLRSDDYKGPPLFYMLFLPEHKLGKINDQSSFEKEVSKLRNLVKKDMANIDSFIKRWYVLHEPSRTDKEGNLV